MYITEWFDVKDIEHLRAFVHLINTGTWPENFLPENIEFTPTWSIELKYMMVEEYLIMMGCTKKKETKHD